MTQTRGYTPEKHSALPYVDKEYKQLLDKIADKTDRSKKRATELAIQAYAVQIGII